MRETEGFHRLLGTVKLLELKSPSLSDANQTSQMLFMNFVGVLSVFFLFVTVNGAC